MNVVVTITLVILWFPLQAFQSQSAQTFAPLTTIGEPGSCPSEDERETLRQIICTNVSNVITNFVAAWNGNVNDQQRQCGDGIMDSSGLPQHE